MLLRFDDHLQRWSRASASPDESLRWAELAVAFSYLYHFHHGIYRMLWRDGADFWQELLNWCSGQESRADDRLKHLKHLEQVASPPTGASSGERAPTTQPTSFVTVFHDPAADDVLHIESLVREIGPLRSDEARGYLLD